MLLAEQRARQKSDPHDTNAIDESVALAVMYTEVVPILTNLQEIDVLAVGVSDVSLQRELTHTWLMQRKYGAEQVSATCGANQHQVLPCGQ